MAHICPHTCLWTSDNLFRPLFHVSKHRFRIIGDAAERAGYQIIGYLHVFMSRADVLKLAQKTVEIPGRDK